MTLLISLLIIFQISRAVPIDDDLNIQMDVLYLSKKTLIQPYRCFAYIVSSNYRRIQLLINSKNIDNLLITDQLLDYNDCNKQSMTSCPENSTFCINQKSLQGSTRLSIGKCVSQFYIYLYILDYQKGDILAKFASVDGCDSIAESQYTFCASIPIEQCGVEIITDSSCNKKCFKLQCTYLDKADKNNSALSACLPAFIQKQRFNQICNRQYFYSSFKTKYPVAHYCGGKNNHRIPTSINQIKTLSLGELIIYLLIIATVIFIISIIWYRFQLSRTGTAPFTPPSWIPQSIYPRRRSNIFEEQKQLQNYHQI